MRKLLIACSLILIGAVSAKAQENRGFEVSGTYQYVRFNPGGGADGVNCHGGSRAGRRRFLFPSSGFGGGCWGDRNRRAAPPVRRPAARPRLSPPGVAGYY